MKLSKATWPKSARMPAGFAIFWASVWFAKLAMPGHSFLKTST